MNRFALLAFLPLLLAADWKKGSTVYFPADLFVTLSPQWLAGIDVPHEDLQCPTTARCIYRHRACLPSFVGAVKKDKIYVTLRPNLSVWIEGDWASFASSSGSACRDADEPIVKEIGVGRFEFSGQH